MKRDRVLRTIWAEDAADITFLEATLREIVGHNTDRIGKLSVSNRASGWSVDQGGLVGELFRAMHHERRQRRFRYGDIRVRAFDYHVCFQNVLQGSGFLQDLQDNSIIKRGKEKTRMPQTENRPLNIICLATYFK